MKFPFTFVLLIVLFVVQLVAIAAQGREFSHSTGLGTTVSTKPGGKVWIFTFPWLKTFHLVFADFL